MSTERITADDIRDAMDMAANEPYRPWQIVVPPSVHRWMESHRRPGEHDAALIARLLTTCDGCLADGDPCPGRPAHCAKRWHCTAMDEVCALDAGRHDHSSQCCNCGRASLIAAGSPGMSLFSVVE